MCLREREGGMDAGTISPTYVGLLLNLVLISSWSLINPRKGWTHRPIDFPFFN